MAHAEDDDRALDGDGEPLDPAAEAARQAAAAKALAAVKANEWAALERRLTRMARALGILRKDAIDFAHDAILLVCSGNKRWDPARAPLATYLRRVLRTLVDTHYGSARVKHEAPPDSDRDGEAPRSDPHVLQAKIMLEERDAGLDRFAELSEIVKDEPDALGVVRASQKGIDKPKEQAAYLGIPEERVYAARRRIKAVLKRIYAKDPEGPRLPKLAARGVHAKGGQGNKQGDDE